MRIDNFESDKKKNGHSKAIQGVLFVPKIFFKFIGKIFFPFVSCFMQMVYLFVILFLVFTYFFIKLGIWDIPFLSDYLFTPNEPRVNLQSISHESNIASLNTKVSQLIFTGSNSLIISNQELTTLLRSFYQDSDLFVLPFIQASTYQGAMEFYAVMEKPFTSSLLITMSVKNQNEQLHLDVDKAYIGDQRVPSFLFDFFVIPQFERSLNTFLSELQTIKDVKTQEGILEIEFQKP